MNIVGKSIDSRIDEFKNTNYVMQYPFDPTVQLPNNEFPNPNKTKITPATDEVAPVVTEPQADTDDDAEEMEMLELEAEALKMKLKLLEL